MIIDITQPLFQSEVYPGDTPPTYRRVKQMPQDPCNLTDLSMCAHNGTHADAPSHFVQDGLTIGEAALDAFYGACAVKAWDGAIPPNCERLLLKDGYAVSPEAAKAIAASPVRLVGIEPQSVGEGYDKPAVHKILLGAGIVVLEGLRLSHVEAGGYTLSAFPLSLGDCEGSPVRAVLIK